MIVTKKGPVNIYSLRSLLLIQARERKKIQEEIATLSKSRNDYVAKKQHEAAKANVNTVNDAVTRAIRR